MVRVVNIRAPGRGTFVKVCRPTIFGNPIALGKPCPECSVVHVRDPQMKALVCYGRYLIRRTASDDDFAKQVLALADSKRIGCWCAPAPCHADLLALYANTSRQAGSSKYGYRALIERVDEMADAATRAVLIYCSASALQLLDRCPGPAVIPAYDRTSHAAEQGTADHEALLPWLSGQPDATLPDTSRGRAIGRLSRTVGDMEVKIAVNPRTFTARLLPTHDEQGQPYGHRDYSACKPGEISGTADIWPHESGGVPSGPIGELKTGAVYVEADGNYQTLYFAFAWWLIHGTLAATRLIQSGEDRAFCQERTPSASALMNYQRRLVRIMDRIDAARATPAGEMLPLVTGEHCQFCDVQLAGRCPAFAERIKQPLTGDIVADVVTAKLAASHATAQRELVVDTLGNGVHETESGTVCRELTYTRKVVDVKVALKLYPELAASVKCTIPSKAIDDLIRSRLAGRRWDDVKAEIEAELHAAGALEFRQTRRLKIHVAHECDNPPHSRIEAVVAG